MEIILIKLPFILIIILSTLLLSQITTWLNVKSIKVTVISYAFIALASIVAVFYIVSLPGV